MELLAFAIALHERGQFEEAETVYFGVLAHDQNNVDALHYLGVMPHQQGGSLLAVDLVSRAIEIRPDYVDSDQPAGRRACVSRW